MTPCSSCSNPLVCSDLGNCYIHSPQFKVPLAMTPTPRTDAILADDTGDSSLIHNLATLAQLSRICQEGFGNDDTIGLEPADDYVLRKLAELRADNAELLARLQDRTQSHLVASARDVQTIQQQAVELAKWQAEAARLSAEREHNANMAGMWQALAEGLADALYCISAHDGPGFPYGTCCNIAGQALAAYEAAKAGGAAAKACDWKMDYDGNWDTSCKQCMSFEYAPPVEQGYKFCHHCGLPINFIKFIKPLDESLD